MPWCIDLEGFIKDIGSAYGDLFSMVCIANGAAN